MVDGGELLLEGNVGGSEALVVDKEALDLLVLDGEALIDDGEVRGERLGGWLMDVVKEGGVPRAEAVTEGGWRGVVDRWRRAIHRVGRHPAPSRHRRRETLGQRGKGFGGSAGGLQLAEEWRRRHAVVVVGSLLLLLRSLTADSRPAEGEMRGEGDPEVGA